MVNDPKRIACSFLIPLVRDSDRLPHPAVLWRLLQDELIELSGGFSGPEAALFYRKVDAVPGAWMPAGAATAVEDECRRYTVILDGKQRAALHALLRRVGNSFDQRVIYLETAEVAVEFLEISSTDGFL